MPHETRESWHTRPIANLTAQFGTDVQQGLTCQEAAQRLQQGGPNEIRKEQAVSALTLLAGQFGNLVIWVLSGAALSSVALGEVSLPSQATSAPHVVQTAGVALGRRCGPRRVLADVETRNLLACYRRSPADIEACNLLTCCRRSPTDGGMRPHLQRLQLARALPVGHYSRGTEGTSNGKFVFAEWDLNDHCLGIRVNGGNRACHLLYPDGCGGEGQTEEYEARRRANQGTRMCQALHGVLLLAGCGWPSTTAQACIPASPLERASGSNVISKICAIRKVSGMPRI